MRLGFIVIVTKPSVIVIPVEAILLVLISALVGVFAYRWLPSPATGLRGRLGRFLHSFLFAVLAWLVLGGAA